MMETGEIKVVGENSHSTRPRNRLPSMCFAIPKGSRTHRKRGWKPAQTADNDRRERRLADLEEACRSGEEHPALLPRLRPSRLFRGRNIQGVQKGFRAVETARRCGNRKRAEVSNS